MSTTVTAPTCLLRAAKHDLSTEKRAQGDVEYVLTYAGVDYQHEVRPTDSERVGFMAEGVAIEFVGEPDAEDFLASSRKPAHEPPRPVR